MNKKMYDDVFKDKILQLYKEKSLIEEVTSLKDFHNNLPHYLTDDDHEKIPSYVTIRNWLEEPGYKKLKALLDDPVAQRKNNTEPEEPEETVEPEEPEETEEGEDEVKIKEDIENLPRDKKPNTESKEHQEKNTTVIQKNKNPLNTTNLILGSGLFLVTATVFFIKLKGGKNKNDTGKQERKPREEPRESREYDFDL
jgi:hypothetical protein